MCLLGFTEVSLDLLASTLVAAASSLLRPPRRVVRFAGDCLTFSPLVFLCFVCVSEVSYSHSNPLQQQLKCRHRGSVREFLD